MFNSILHYMGVHGEVLANMQSLELAQKLLHQGLKRADMRDELFMQVRCVVVPIYREWASVLAPIPAGRGHV
jgi:hypothetical protein